MVGGLVAGKGERCSVTKSQQRRRNRDRPFLMLGRSPTIQAFLNTKAAELFRMTWGRSKALIGHRT